MHSIDEESRSLPGICSLPNEHDIAAALGKVTAVTITGVPPWIDPRRGEILVNITSSTNMKVLDPLNLPIPDWYKEKVTSRSSATEGEMQATTESDNTVALTCDSPKAHVTAISSLKLKPCPVTVIIVPPCTDPEKGTMLLISAIGTNK